MSLPEVKRLHITPLDAPLLNTILNPTVRSLATDISFHTIQTFPDRNYGFVTLPTVEADKLVKKLNGAILKGKKLQIQEAKLRKGIARDERATLENPSTRTLYDYTMGKKRKAGDDAIEGFELPSERRVKRGWTEVPEKTKRSRTLDKKEKKDDKRKKGQKSKYTSDPECLFRTIPPPNKVEPAKSDKKKKSKSSKGDAIVVHEFEKLTTHPTFLRVDQDSSSKNLTSEYVEGKGWVDRDGNVKEVPKLKNKEKHTKRAKPLSKSAPKVSSNKTTAKQVSSSDDDETSSSGSSSEEDPSDSDSASAGDDSPSEKAVEDSVIAISSPAPESPTTSQDSVDEISSSSSSSEEDLDDSNSESSKYLISETAAKYLYGFRSEEDSDELSSEAPSVQEVSSSSSSESESESEPESESGSDNDDDGDDKEEQEHESTPSNKHQPVDEGSISSAITPQKKVHPLEALFKRPATKAANPAAKPPLEVNTSFSFFGAAEENSDIEENDDHDAAHHAVTAEPQTPFTQKDLQWRALRSGAPTPDTAAVAKFKFWEDAEEEKDEEEDEEDVQVDTSKGNKKSKDAASHDTKEKGGDPTDESEFAKWFWDNRGDNNRAWKKRRREAAKEKRQRENRQRGRR